jgi:hypothetical protein
VRVPEIVKPDLPGRVLAEFPAEAGLIALELPGDMLAVAVVTLDVAEHERVRPGQRQVHLASLPLHAFHTVTVPASRSTTRGLLDLVSSSTISAPSPNSRTMPAERRILTVARSRSISR